MKAGAADLPWRWSLRLPGHRAIALLAVFAATWALLEGALGTRLEHQYNLMQVVWWRYAAHLALMLAVWGWRQPGQLWRTRRPVFQLARSLLMLVMPLSFVAALYVGEHIDTVWALFWVTPGLILLVAAMWLNERAPVWLWIATLLGAAGAVFILEPPLPQSVPGLLLPLLMALSFSVYVVMTRSLRDEPVVTNLFYTAFGVFVLLSPLMPSIWLMPSLHDAVYLSAIGVVGFVALWALDRACESAPVSHTAPTLFFHLGCMMVVGWVFLGEPLTLRVLAGGVMVATIMVGIWWLQPLLVRNAGTNPVQRGPVRGQ